MGKVCTICGVVMLLAAILLLPISKDIALILNEGVKFICLIAIVNEVLRK